MSPRRPPFGPPGTPLLLDGGLATELQRHGVAITAPWWSSEVLRDSSGLVVLADVHGSYRQAGAQVITANTFRANRRALGRAGLTEAESHAMVACAVGVARDAVRGTEGQVAGSVAPLEDCYHPELVPTDDELREEHGWLIRGLVDAGVDLVLLETMNCLREASIALECTKAVGARAWVSFVCTADGTHLLSGESLGDAVRVVQAGGPEAVLVNCTAIDAIETAAAVLRGVCSVPIGVYPNVEDRTGIEPGEHVDRYVRPGWSTEDFGRRLADLARAQSLDIVGGCCGATPGHVAALHRALNPDAAVA